MGGGGSKSHAPTPSPTGPHQPTALPTTAPTPLPGEPTFSPTAGPTPKPGTPTFEPTRASLAPTFLPDSPTARPSPQPTNSPLSHPPTLEPSSKPTIVNEPTASPTKGTPTQRMKPTSEPTQQPTNATPTKKPTTGAPVEELVDNNGIKDEENGSDTKEVDSTDKGSLTFNPTPASFKKDEESFRKLTLKRTTSTKTSTGTSSSTSSIKKSSNKKSSTKDKSSSSTKRQLEAVASSAPVEGRRLMAVGSLDQTTLLSGVFVVAALLLLTFVGLRRTSKLSSAAAVAAGKRLEVQETA